MVVLRMAILAHEWPNIGPQQSTRFAPSPSRISVSSRIWPKLFGFLHQLSG